MSAVNNFNIPGTGEVATVPGNMESEHAVIIFRPCFRCIKLPRRPMHVSAKLKDIRADLVSFSVVAIEGSILRGFGYSPPHENSRLTHSTGNVLANRLG